MELEKGIKLIKLKRYGKDTCITGKKNCGKTTILTMIGLMNKCIYDCDIYTNYPVNYEHIMIDDIEDIKKIPNDDKRKIFLGDDFELYLPSESKSKNIKELKEILLNFGKKNIFLYYAIKRELNIQKSLRESTSEFWDITLKKWLYNDNDYNNDKLKKYANFLYINVDRFDENIDYIDSFRIYNIDKIFRYFDTKYIIKPL